MLLTRGIYAGFALASYLVRGLGVRQDQGGFVVKIEIVYCAV
jgi:hypothetical protein